jgi:hypothetical protein
MRKAQGGKIVGTGKAPYQFYSSGTLGETVP